MKRYSIFVVLVAVLGLIFTANSPAAPPRMKVLTIGTDAEARTLDPHSDVGTPWLNQTMFDTLVRRNDKLQIEGALAESWKNIDPVTWEFKLRKGVKFHDGSELTAADVKFSFDRMIDPQLNLHVRSFVATIIRAEVVDSGTIRLITREPDVLLPIRLAFGFVVPERAFKAAGPEAFGKRPIGSGPFKIVEWVKDERVVMEANKEYWGGAPKVDRLIWKPITEASTRMAALKTGQVDIVTHVPAQEVGPIKANANLRVMPVRSNRVTFLGFDTFHPPFNNVLLRQAVNYAVDVDSITKKLLGDFAVRTLLAPDMYFGVDSTAKPYPYDPKRAKQLLAKAGYPNGLRITIEASRAGMTENDTEIVQAVAGELAKVGITSDIRTQEYGGFVDRWLSKDVRGMYLWSFGGPWLDMDALMGAHFDSKRRALYYNRPDLDALITEARGSFSTPRRLALYKQITRIIKNDAPWLFLFATDDIYAVNKRVKNWQPRADEVISVFQTDVE